MVFGNVILQGIFAVGQRMPSRIFPHHKSRNSVDPNLEDPTRGIKNTAQDLKVDHLSTKLS